MSKIFLVLVAISLLFHANGQDWKWINPSPTGNQLNVVKYLDSSALLAVGNYGTILLSGNGGQNWTPVNSHTVSDFLSISVISKDTIFVSSRDLAVLKTTDGGVSWNVLREGSYGNRNTSKVVFVNSSVGYLLGDGMEEFFKTTDSGKTWIKLQMELNFQGVTSLYFTSAETGYASIGSGHSGAVLKTTDGGATWETINLPVSWPFNSVVFTSKQTGYLVGDLGNILKTEDAGKTWTIQNQFPSSLTNTNLYSVDFINQDTGYVVGGTEILKTIDGGKHWVLNARSEFDLRSVSFIDSLHGICAGGDWLHEYSGLSATTNGGVSWNEISSTISDRYLDKIKFVNRDTGYIVGGNTSTYGGFVLKTADSGVNWKSLDIGFDTYWLSDLSLPDEKTIYAVGNYGQIVKSDDAGLSWVNQNSNTQENLETVSFLDNSTGYCFGSNGTMLKTTDGGKHWIKLESPTIRNLSSAFFKDKNTGFVVSYDWSIDSCTLLLTTTNGGLNWKKNSIGRLRSPNKIVFVNQDTAFIAGGFGGILKTTDGGKNWEDSYHHGNSYYDMFFSDENTGYVLGEDGEISMTENCGKNWTVLNSGTDKDLLSVCFTDINTGFAVGNNGIILKTTNSGSSLRALQQAFYDLCLGDSVWLQANFIGGTKPLHYDWDQLGTSSSISVRPDSTTRYKLTIKDQENDTIQVNLLVAVNWVPAPVITQRGDTLISNARYGIRWFKNDSLIADVYSDTLIVEKSGDYSAIIYDYGCYSEKSNVVHLVTGVSNISCDDDFILFPNPVRSNFNLTIPANCRQFRWSLFDDKGKLIRNQSTSGSRVNVNISDLPSGVYFIQIISEDQVRTKKIIKK